MKMCRRGKITGDLDEFNQIVIKNADPDWDAVRCFSRGARCNRMGLEINLAYAKLKLLSTQQTQKEKVTV